MSNAERWDHSGYKELQNEEKSNIKRPIGNKKPFYKFKEGANANEKPTISDYTDPSHRKNQNKNFSNFSHKFTPEEWQVENEKGSNEGDFNNQNKNKFKKKRNNEFSQNNEGNSDKYFKPNYTPEDYSNKSDNSNSYNNSLNNSSISNRPYNNRKSNTNFLPNGHLGSNAIYYGINKGQQNNLHPNYNTLFNPSYNSQSGYNVNNPPRNSQFYQPNANNSFRVGEEGEEVHFKNESKKDRDSSKLTRVSRSQNFQTNETNDTNASEEGHSMNSMIDTPQRNSQNSIGISNNTQNTPGYSPKNEQIFMSNLLKMPSNMNLQSPMRQMNENMIYHNFQNTNRGMNYLNVSQPPYGTVPISPMRMGELQQNIPMPNMTSGVNPGPNPIPNFSPGFNSFNQSPYNNSQMNFSKMNSPPIMEEMSNVNNELRNNQRKFQSGFNRESNNYPVNIVNPNQTNFNQMGNAPNMQTMSNPNNFNQMGNINMMHPGNLNNFNNMNMQNMQNLQNMQNMPNLQNMPNMQNMQNMPNLQNMQNVTPPIGNGHNKIYDINSNNNQFYGNRKNNNNFPSNQNYNLNPNKNFASRKFNNNMNMNQSNVNPNMVPSNNFQLPNNIMNNTGNNLPLSKMKYVKSDKYIIPNSSPHRDLKGMSQGMVQVGQMPLRNNMIPNPTNQMDFNNLKKWKNSNASGMDRSSNPTNQKGISYMINNPMKETNTKQVNNMIREGEEGYLSSGHSDYEVAEEEAKLSSPVKTDNILYVSVRLQEKNETISVAKGGDVYQTAKSFVLRHHLNYNLIKPIVERIKQALASIDSLMDLPLNDEEYKSLSQIETIYKNQNEEEECLEPVDLSCITDLGSSSNYLSDSFSLSYEEVKKLERLNVSR